MCILILLLVKNEFNIGTTDDKYRVSIVDNKNAPISKENLAGIIAHHNTGDFTLTLQFKRVNDDAGGITIPSVSTH